MVKAVIADTDFRLVSALCNFVDVSDANQLAVVLVNVFEYCGRVDDLINLLIRAEVRATSRTNLLSINHYRL
jgi:hypothetical protein